MDSKVSTSNEWDDILDEPAAPAGGMPAAGAASPARSQPPADKAPDAPKKGDDEPDAPKKAPKKKTAENKAPDAPKKGDDEPDAPKKGDDEPDAPKKAPKKKTAEDKADAPARSKRPEPDEQKESSAPKRHKSAKAAPRKKQPTAAEVNDAVREAMGKRPAMVVESSDEEEEEDESYEEEEEDETDDEEEEEEEEESSGDEKPKSKSSSSTDEPASAAPSPNKSKADRLRDTSNFTCSACGGKGHKSTARICPNYVKGAHRRNRGGSSAARALLAVDAAPVAVAAPVPAPAPRAVAVAVAPPPMPPTGAFFMDPEYQQEMARIYEGYHALRRLIARYGSDSMAVHMAKGVFQF